ncbi:hypothetical protein KQI49_03535 [Virgibacillus sp. MSJ-26]|uniref:hypothetical protein n=1 Tax=Virgibacillus sp. MSJ-26 TaxID=2841522 RepID=UPI001C0F8AD0|nr:hypothetical protein [Virgibacillus sp. MSJ-26]MBU5465900.1 hypothetical protein [Virgibacillus sp. MSJ-26]
MSRNLIILFAIILTGILSACGSSGGEKLDDSEIKDTFTGTIETIENEVATVDIKEGKILRSGKKVTVDLSVADDTTFKIGDEIKVGYEGAVRESGPLGINTTFVELIE